MKRYVKYILVAGMALSMQGCFSFTHNIEPVNLQNIKNHKQVMVSNQNFHCQNAFVGGAHKFVINKDDMIKGSKLPQGMQVSALGELAGGVVDKRAVFLKVGTSMDRDLGFLVFPDGKFVYNRGKEQLGVVGPYGASDEFMFNIDCHYSGNKSPFKPLSNKKFESLKNN